VDVVTAAEDLVNGVKRTKKRGVWHDYDGSGIPIEWHDAVKVKYRNGKTEESHASDFEWSHTDSAYDIMKYKLL
jgi:glucosamine 6-phosphate synthetase-like amidotransferase/phosphosugar isomerase protein